MVAVMAATPLSCHGFVSPGLGPTRDSIARRGSVVHLRITKQQDWAGCRIGRGSAELGQRLACLKLSQRSGTVDGVPTLAPGRGARAAADQEIMTPPFNVLVTGSTKGNSHSGYLFTLEHVPSSFG